MLCEAIQVHVIIVFVAGNLIIVINIKQYLCKNHSELAVPALLISH